MERQILGKFELLVRRTPDNNLCMQTLTLARSLIVNPSSSEPTISIFFDTLSSSLRTNSDAITLENILSLLSDLSIHWPRLAPNIFAAVSAFSLLPDAPARAAADAFSLLLSLAERHQSLISSLAEFSEGLFTSLCFRPCVSVRLWLLRNAERCCVRPSLLLTLFLGFTKDPYPLVRGAALDGLVGLCKCILVEDYSLVEGCYFRAVELLFDSENSVRCSAVRAVAEWGKVLVTSNDEKHRTEWSNALFVQLCSMVRDMSVDVRVEAFNALGKVGMVSEDILMQTLSKNVIAVMKGKKFPGQFAAKQFKLPASSAAGAFVHGMEDEYHEVRKSACCSLRTISVLSANFAADVLNLLMDVLNDDSMAVRLQALETMNHMALCNCLKGQETHMHMFLGTLLDSTMLIRSAARKVLQFMKLHKLDMFKLSVDGLIENLEMHPQDEAEVFSALFHLGRNHGNFAVSIINEVSHEIEPSSEGKLEFDSARVAALLMLAISTPLSLEPCVCNFPPRLFSYAVTMLGRISHGLVDVMDQNTLLAYLSFCSQSTVVLTSELFKDGLLKIIGHDLPNYDFLTSSHVAVQLQSSDGAFVTDTPKSRELMQLATQSVGSQLEELDELTLRIKLILERVSVIWLLTKRGCMTVVHRTLRSWKEELIAAANSYKPSGRLVFALQYLQVVKLVGKVWMLYMSPREHCNLQKGDLGFILEKLDRCLREIRFRFIGLSEEEESHVLELVLLACMMRLSSVEAYCHHFTLKKLYYVISRIESFCKEGFNGSSKFVIELKNSLHEFNASVDGSCFNLTLLKKTLEHFNLKQFRYCRELIHKRAELDVPANDFGNPLSFISGLPIGIQLEITLYNISSENKLWLRLSLDTKTEFVFLDLTQLVETENFSKFTYIAPVYGTPKLQFLSLKVCIGLECVSEDVHLAKDCRGPKHELAYLCKEKEVYLSMVVK